MVTNPCFFFISAVGETDNKEDVLTELLGETRFLGTPGETGLLTTWRVKAESARWLLAVSRRLLVFGELALLYKANNRQR